MRELEMLDDDFLKEYQQRRLEEMRKLFRVCVNFIMGNALKH